MTTKDEILELIEETWVDREVMPHYGLIPDWYERYKQLAVLVWKYFDEQDEQRQSS